VQKDCDPAAAGPSDACQADFDAARKFGAPPAPKHQARALNGAPTNARPNSQP
jgi:hypothetical protein